MLIRATYYSTLPRADNRSHRNCSYHLMTTSHSISDSVGERVTGPCVSGRVIVRYDSHLADDRRRA